MIYNRSNPLTIPDHTSVLMHCTWLYRTAFCALLKEARFVVGRLTINSIFFRTPKIRLIALYVTQPYNIWYCTPFGVDFVACQMSTNSRSRRLDLTSDELFCPSNWTKSFRKTEETNGACGEDRKVFRQEIFKWLFNGRFGHNHASHEFTETLNLSQLRVLPVE